ncbi:MAG: LysE family translocator [Mesorhizobium sp.]|uniref:LysE family translocator n=1 Tax=unclassified Mesorhizobium TaxID=325217 RepID=UPI000FE5332B|nr:MULTISPECIES: LysE family translocator [unclassified Mesorhizobium]RWC24916.1 MAG: LysE family translocator [Mesorhizobium sp.]TGT93840.1 LysE family translocator [Mesorhizobium sp. M5C.F.Ca.ET.164.01.1.1]TIU20623.1 MAG: LysE family translocator [Mesorhizobium sp.]TIU80116.1 MAG: LysE family translocator [Mesorhizobium sp.]
MPEFPTYLAFLVAVLGYQLSGPGPDMILVISRGIGQGQRAALATATGCISAGVIQIPLLAMGLASLITSSPIAYGLLQLLGAAYLIAIGTKFLLVRKEAETESIVTSQEGGLAGAFRQGMICNLTNPTALVFMLAVLPQFVHASTGSSAMQFIVLGATMKATGLLVLGAAALASGTVGGWLARNAGFLVWQKRLAGAIMIAVGVRLLLAATIPGRR